MATNYIVFLKKLAYKSSYGSFEFSKFLNFEKAAGANRGKACVSESPLILIILLIGPDWLKKWRDFFQTNH